MLTTIVIIIELAIRTPLQDLPVEHASLHRWYLKLLVEILGFIHTSADFGLPQLQKKSN